MEEELAKMRLTDGQRASDAEPFIRKVRLHEGFWKQGRAVCDPSK
jgi:hypothetical protein